MKNLDARQVKQFDSMLKCLKKELTTVLEDINKNIKIIEDYNENIRKLDSQSVTKNGGI